jgi:uncharacterized membrane protein (DUF485 family)
MGEAMKEKWETRRNVRQILMWLTVFGWLLHVIIFVGVFHGNAGLQLLNALTIIDLVATVTFIGWVIAGVMERKARKAFEAQSNRQK